MKDFVTYLLSQIVDKPEAIQVSQEQIGQGIENLQITVDSSDMGKVIGKQGRIIRAIRDLTKALAVKKNARVNVVLAEE